MTHLTKEGSMRRIHSSFVALALCTTVALPLSAQLPGMGLISGRKPLVQVGFGGGMSVPTSNAKEAFENGVHGRGFMLLNLPGLPSFRFDLSATKFDWKEALPGAPATMTGESLVLGGLGNISINLLKGPIRPYVMAGVGAFHDGTGRTTEDQARHTGARRDGRGARTPTHCGARDARRDQRRTSKARSRAAQVV